MTDPTTLYGFWLACFALATGSGAVYLAGRGYWLPSGIFGVMSVALAGLSTYALMA